MSQSEAQDFLIVGLGASAGGVEALREFFAQVSADSGIAYVVILHLSPEHESHLDAVLQAVTPLPVMQVTETVRVAPDHVYVVPPNQHLAMVDGQLAVSPNTLPEERRAPVDIFFRTLAETHQSRAVCVVLSGSGTDGSMGLKRVKERGGVVFVQNPREAAFNEMPRNAIATDLADDVLPVAAIPARIIAYQASLGSVAIPLAAEARSEAQQQALREVITQLRVRTGHDFSNYKRPTLLRRIERRINVRGLPDVSAYAAFLRETPDEVQALLKDLLISVTNFFRDKAAFAAIEQDVLPRIFASKASAEPVRIWVVGCATGEEAYSIAMLCAERALGLSEPPSVQIFASDIDEAAIAHARQGLYTATDAADVSPERLRRFFTAEDQRYRIRREIREMVLFASHNVLKDPPFSHLDLVTCRNVLIYLNHTAQERVMETLHFALNPGGYLFLGTSESVDGANDLYATANREQHIFQSRIAVARTLLVPDTVPSLPADPPRAARPAAEPEQRARANYGDLHMRLLEQYAPASVVVDQDYHVVHLSGRAGRYLQIGDGQPSSNLLQLIRPELRLELRTALYQALRRQINVDSSSVPIRIDNQAETVVMHVRPVLRQDDPARGFVLVLFEPGPQAPGDVEPVIRADESVMRQLEEEALRLRQQLRAAGEQYEVQTEEFKATNEELQALNEELRSSTEELETSKEELQSINEELRTVNQELKVKVEEATLHSTNLQNLVNSTDIGTIFLDRGLRLKLFTPAARELFNLIPADYGRPLADITHRLLGVDVLADAQAVLDQLQTIEREVRAGQDRTYLLRMLPYRTAEDRIGGVVITFFDITDRKWAEVALRASEGRQAFLLKLSDVLRSLAEPSEIEYQAARALGEHLGANRVGYAEDQGDDRTIAVMRSYTSGVPGIEGRYRYDDYGPELLRALKAGRTLVRPDIAHDPTLTDAEKAAHAALQLGATVNAPLLRAGRLVATLFVHCQEAHVWPDEDLALIEETAERTWEAVERARGEAAQRDSDERFRLLVESARDYAMFLLDGENRITFWSVGAERVFGWSAAEVQGQSGALIFTPEDRASGAVEREIGTALRAGRAEDRRWHIRKDGTRLFIDGVLIRLDEADGRARGFAKIGRDATLQRQAEEARQQAHDTLERRVAERTAELTRLSSTRQELLQRLVTAQEDERRRISRDLHDQMGQQITGILLQVKLLQESQLDAALVRPLQIITTLSQELATEAHQLAVELRPTTLDDVGLVPALSHYAELWSSRTQIPVDLQINGLDNQQLAPNVETALYRVLQEALTNIVRHAQARQVGVILQVRDHEVQLIVEDNGQGFASEAPLVPSRLGVVSMRERVEQVGGTFTIESAPGAGTTVLVRVPVPVAPAGGAA